LELEVLTFRTFLVIGTGGCRSFARLYCIAGSRWSSWKYL